MKKRIAELWVKALRSGKYKQGKSALKVKTTRGITKHCCLGVLCELYQKENEKKLTAVTRRARKNDIVEVAPRTTIYRFGREPVNGESSLPPAVRRWAGIDTDDGAVYTNARTTSLAYMNDNGETFSEIADFISAHVKDL